MKTSTGTRIYHTGNAEDAGDVRYLTGFAAPDPFWAAEGADGRMRLFVSALERGRAAAACPAAEFPEGGVEAWCEREEIRRVAVSEACPVGMADRLRARGIRVAVKKGGGHPERAVKREEEVG